MASEAVMSFAPEIGGLIRNYGELGRRQRPPRRFIVPVALIKHDVPDLI